METNKYILDFQKALIDTPNKTYLIDNEIKQIDSVIYKTQQSNLGLNLGGRMSSSFHLKTESNTVFQIDSNPSKFFNSVFHNYSMNGDYDFNSIPENRFKDRDTKVAKKAISFAEYYKWLKELNLESSQNKSSKKAELSHKQKMLALHYLGLDLSKYENTNSAKILSQILDLDYDNTRKYLSYVSGGKNTVRTKTNLQKIQNLFENQNLNTISNKIKEDIEKF